MKNRKLKQIFDFTDEDLAANQQGYLTDRQRVGARAKRTERLLINSAWFIVLLALSAFGLYLGYQWFQNPTGGLWIGAACLMVAGGLGAFALPFAARRETLAIQQDIENGVVERHAGMGVRERREEQTHNGKEVYFTVRVGTFGLGKVGEETYNAFLNEHCYAVYYLPQSRHVVAVEMVDCLDMAAPPTKAKRIAKVDEMVDIPALSTEKDTTYLVYSLRGQGTYAAAIQWYTAQGEAPRVAWEQQSDDARALHEEATSRLPKIVAQLQNRGWQVTAQTEDGSVDTEDVALRQVMALERFKTEVE